MMNRKLSAYTTEEMLALERLASEEYGVSTSQMMQQAGQSLHDFVAGELPDVKRLLVLAGKGNNGGDALVAGDLLRDSGYKVMSLRVEKPFGEAFDFTCFDLILDGLFGFSLRGNPRAPMNEIIEQINCSSIPILSVDVPSGLEVYSGKVMEPAVRASYTLSLGMLKRGLKENSDHSGKIYLGNLGIPAEAYREKGVEVPDFTGKSYLLV